MIVTGKSPEAFRTISEVSEWLETPAHVLRFWESKFTQIRPVKGAGGRRYYRPEDMALLGGIKALLHEQGMTIKGVQKLLRERGIRHVSGLGPQPMPLPPEPNTGPAPLAMVPDNGRAVATRRTVLTTLAGADLRALRPHSALIAPQVALLRGLAARLAQA